MYLVSLLNYFPGKFTSTCDTVHAMYYHHQLLCWCQLSYGETVLGEQVYKGVNQQAVISSKVSISVYVEITDSFLHFT